MGKYKCVKVGFWDIKTQKSKIGKFKLNKTELKHFKKYGFISTAQGQRALKRGKC